MTSRTSSGKKKKDFRFFLFPFILFIFFSLFLSLSLAFSLTFSASFHPPLSLSPQRLPGRARAHPRLVPRLQDPRRQAREQVRVRAERISFLCSRFFFLSSFSLLLSLLLLSPLSPLLSLSLSKQKKRKHSYNNKVQPRQFALDVIEETNGFWRDLTTGKRENDEGMAF
jgi:hypothetical protein